MYTSEKRGSDETGDGSEAKPFKSVLAALKQAEKEPWPQIFVDPKEKAEGQPNQEGYELIAKSQLKKIMKFFLRDQHKSASLAVKDKEEAEARLKNLEDAKKIVLEEDKSLPEALRIKIRDASFNKEKRVKVYGWVHRLRRQGLN